MAVVNKMSWNRGECNAQRPEVDQHSVTVTISQDKEKLPIPTLDKPANKKHCNNSSNLDCTQQLSYVSLVRKAKSKEKNLPALFAI